MSKEYKKRVSIFSFKKSESSKNSERKIGRKKHRESILKAVHNFLGDIGNDKKQNNSKTGL